jgi:hypothetical protein
MIIHRFSPAEKRMLKLMIIDCDLHHMTERESRTYINKRFGRIISRRTYYNYKTKVYEGRERVRIAPEWVRAPHLSSMLRELENTPLILDKDLLDIFSLPQPPSYYYGLFARTDAPIAKSRKFIDGIKAEEKASKKKFETVPANATIREEHV